jgi:hypothetical protein
MKFYSTTRSNYYSTACIRLFSSLCLCVQVIYRVITCTIGDQLKRALASLAASALYSRVEQAQIKMAWPILTSLATDAHFYH